MCEGVYKHICVGHVSRWEGGGIIIFTLGKLKNVFPAYVLSTYAQKQTDPFSSKHRPVFLTMASTPVTCSGSFSILGLCNSIRNMSNALHYSRQNHLLRMPVL